MSYLILILLSVVVAYLEATDDARDIANGKKIDHKKQVIERSIILGLIVGSLVLANRGHDGKWHWSSLLLVPICWASFTISFRWMLNKFRGKRWSWMGPAVRTDKDSTYDGCIWRIRLAFGGWFKPLKEHNWLFIQQAGAAIKIERQVARIAYAFELFILTLSTWGYFTL